MKATLFLLMGCLALLPGQSMAVDPEPLSPAPKSALELIEILKNTDGVYMWPYVDARLNWVREEDIDALMKLLDSPEPCAHIVLPISSFMPPGRSTVGYQAAYLIEGFWKRYYPTQLSSHEGVPRAADIRHWHWKWQRLKKAAEKQE